MTRQPNLIARFTMKIWKNTSTLNGYDSGLKFTKDKTQADIALLGSKTFNLDDICLTYNIIFKSQND